MNRRGGETLDLAAERFMASMLAQPQPETFGPKSKMCGRVSVRCQVSSEAQLLGDETRDLGAVRTALRLAHDVADERPDGLHVARLDLLGRAGV